MVEYGPVEIGGTEYICPLRSVVTMRVRTVSTVKMRGRDIRCLWPLRDATERYGVYGLPQIRGGDSHASGV